ncbi:protein bric-a-brac 1-like isoform X3 [Macrosteles quadrilineatus]|uniref:protein bric-a-brac 1-like isoform X3 n=1 Tax=Macrosteles quadrilineatus TaxID=74068 RepID=UPI0023E20CC8|nr:protein bric-a-brac 1-like isoform X3 [Macrosteles quadrilineatus]
MPEESSHTKAESPSIGMHHYGPGGGAGSPQQFCLRWNNYQSNLTNVFDQLLQSESFVDVTLACDGHSVKAHKMVLSACSPYFQALFFDNPCQHPIVILKDIKWPELKAVVEFMYKGEINVSQEQIGPLLKVAESLKVRGLADVNSEHDLETKTGDESVSMSPNRPSKKRRRASAEPSSPAEDASEALELVTTSPSTPSSLPPPATPGPATPGGPNPMMALSLPPPPPPPPPQSAPSAADDCEIKPGIAEMIREEERAKMLESSHAWLGASTSSLAADSYQYQLQSMWQKCWNTNQSLVHNLRFRERGPLKSWRPETMAEAILSVLKEGLSLSQAARKYDIPYPTFVLYANRVHNMLGPSADGGTDLRPKGRGRPQRILLGIWPEAHIQGVIRAVVFRDPQHIKEDPMNLGYPRLQVVSPLNQLQQQASLENKRQQQQQEQQSMYASTPCSEVGVVSPSSAASAVLAVAQNLRQQMLAAAHHGGDPNFSFLAAHYGNGTGLGVHSPLPSPVDSSPRSSPLNAANNNLEVGLGMGYKHMKYENIARAEHLFQDEIEDLVKRPNPSDTPKVKSGLEMGYKAPIVNESMNNIDIARVNDGMNNMNMARSTENMNIVRAAAESMNMRGNESLNSMNMARTNENLNNMNLARTGDMNMARPRESMNMSRATETMNMQRSENMNMARAAAENMNMARATENMNLSQNENMNLARANENLNMARAAENLSSMNMGRANENMNNMNMGRASESMNSMRAGHLFQDDIDELVKRPQPSDTPKVKVGIGVSGMAFPAKQESFPTPFQGDMEDLVKSPPAQTPQGPKEQPLCLQVDQRE